MGFPLRGLEGVEAFACSEVAAFIREQLFVQGERYRRINIRMSHEGRDLRVEHSELAQAVLNRNTPLATELMREHLRLTETLTLQSLMSADTAVA